MSEEADLQRRVDELEERMARLVDGMNAVRALVEGWQSGRLPEPAVEGEVATRKRKGA